MGRPTHPPYLKRLMLKAENQSYRLDREAGRLRIPIRAREHVTLDLPLSEMNRSIIDLLAQPGGAREEPSGVESGVLKTI